MAQMNPSIHRCPKSREESQTRGSNLKKKESNLPKTSVVNLSQIVTVDKNYLKECVGIIPKSIVNEVNNNLKMILNLF